MSAAARASPANRQQPHAWQSAAWVGHTDARLLTRPPIAPNHTTRGTAQPFLAFAVC